MPSLKKKHVVSMAKVAGGLYKSTGHLRFDQIPVHQFSAGVVTDSIVAKIEV